jgi:hypothetical protein
MRLNGMLAVTATALFVPAAALAQLQGALGVGGGIGQGLTGAWVRESRIAPAARFAAPHGFLLVDATAVERNGELTLERSSVTVAASTAPFGPFRLTAGGRHRDDRLTPLETSSLTSALSARRGASGIWVGSNHDRGDQAQLQLGAWRVLRAVMLSVTSSTRSASTVSRFQTVHHDSLPTDTGYVPYNSPGPDSIHVSHSRRWSDVEARADWSGGRLTLSASLTGSRLTPARSDSTAPSRAVTWGRVNAALRLNDRVSLVAGAGTLPAGLGAPRSRTSFASLGFRFAPASLLRDPPPAAIRPVASAFQVLALDNGTHRFVLRAPGARTVEISGDFLGWKAMPLRETAPDVWEATLPIAAGTHRVNVRVNGDRWSAPPGLPAVDDEFNGRVGLLVIR